MPHSRDIAMTAIDLLRVGCDFIALVGAIAFDHRSQQRQQIVGGNCRSSSVCALWLRSACSAPHRHKARIPSVKAFGIHQHPAHVGVDEQRVGLLVEILRAGQCAALPAVMRILHCILIGDFGLPRPCWPTPRRAIFIMMNMAARPLFSSPTR